MKAKLFWVVVLGLGRSGSDGVEKNQLWMNCRKGDQVLWNGITLSLRVDVSSSRLAFSINRLNGCLSLYVDPVTDWRPVQGVLRHSPNDSWDLLQHPRDPVNNKFCAKFIFMFIVCTNIPSQIPCM